MGITFYLMSKKGFDVLDAIIKSNKYCKQVDLVVIGEDKNVQNDYSKEIKELCASNNINYKYREENIKIISEYCIAISWRWLINSTSKLIVLHDSLLPKYRGFAPLVNALKNKENKIGVTALYASKEYDRGDIILQEKISIKYPIKIVEAIDKIGSLYILIVEKLLNKIFNEESINAIQQNEKHATYSLWLDELDYFINWTWSAKKIKRFIDSVGFPYNGAKSSINELVVTINEATVAEDVKIENRTVGKVIFVENGKPLVVCGKGLLKIEEAFIEKTKESLLPLKKFRTQFK